MRATREPAHLIRGGRTVEHPNQYAAADAAFSQLRQALAYTRTRTIHAFENTIMLGSHTVRLPTDICFSSSQQPSGTM
jgi:hypothetical protein